MSFPRKQLSQTICSSLSGPESTGLQSLGSSLGGEQSGERQAQSLTTIQEAEESQVKMAIENVEYLQRCQLAYKEKKKEFTCSQIASFKKIRQRNTEIMLKEMEADDDDDLVRSPLKRKSTKKFHDPVVSEGELIGKGMRKHKYRADGKGAIKAEIFQQLEEVCDFQQQISDILSLVMLQVRHKALSMPHIVTECLALVQSEGSEADAETLLKLQAFQQTYEQLLAILISLKQQIEHCHLKD